MFMSKVPFLMSLTFEVIFVTINLTRKTDTFRKVNEKFAVSYNHKRVPASKATGSMFAYKLSPNADKPKAYLLKAKL